jgi:DNA-directed RNA polymerase subunit N (RpoN/RPB10)
MTSHTGPKAQRPYQQCTRCIMDTTDPDIVFDDNGVCNHCHRHDMLMNERAIPEEKKAATLAELIANIKADGAGKPYDCVIGVSGGVDSTYVAWLTKEYGLRPLAVHLDNGWNSDLAVSNIEKTLEKLGIDLHTHVINWPEFRDLQISFLKACTPDGEVPTDHAIFALLLQMASKYGKLGARLYRLALYEWRAEKVWHCPFGDLPTRLIVLAGLPFLLPQNSIGLDLELCRLHQRAGHGRAAE